ncbi:TonB-dependent receptor [Brevundimonas aurifodinae]|uniref:TonB-dependent receptor n=2 Tax=Brevundimonas TaxID=41275 RepID=A0ABV1NMP6_9CAUL|nr:MAG: TonB-dependent receptor [Brevundimonas sp. 12-68-7]OYX31585.1 MAG: TonB-dependent receptor [Brevundimonas subvibrioides]
MRITKAHPRHGRAGGWGRALLLGACSLAALTTATGVHAQEATSAQTGETQLDEIVVTARRRAESLQDVPVAVSAFSEERLSDLQADDISGIQYSVPNLYLDRGDGANAVVYLRGVGQNDSLAFADPGVGIYVDDVFIARSQAAFLELFDVDRIEVLRGPQGTLYGRNTIGGAVKFVSSPPPSTPDAYLEAGIGNYDARILKGRLGGPLIDGVLNGKIAFAWSEREGYAENSIDGQDDGDQNSLAGRIALDWTPSDRLQVLLSVDAKRDRPDTSRSPVRETALTGALTNGTLVTFPAATDPYEVDVNANGLSDLTGYGASVTVRYDMSDAVTLESITAYRELDFDLNLDADGSPLPILDILLLQDQTQFSQEFRASYDAGGRFTGTAGVYYFKDEDTTFSGVDNGGATIFGFPVTVFGFQTSSLADTRQDTESWAIFADVSYDLTERLSIGAGLRYTTEEKSSTRRFENFFDPTVSVIDNTPPFLAGQGTAGTPITGDEDFDAFTPKVSLAYSPNDDLLLYASASRGFKSGGFDGRATNDFSFEPFRPEFVWSYEAGAKITGMDGRLIFNAAYFYNDYTDIQVTSFGSDPVTGVFVSLFTNAAAATIQGLEFELAARPTDQLSINASLGLLDAQYDEFDILVGGVATDVSDRALVNSPEVNASLAATWEQPLDNGLTLVLHGDAGYRSEIATEITDSPILRQEAYTLVNAFAALRSTDGVWEVRAGVQNATDEAVRVQGFNLADFPGVQLGFYAAPRTYDLRVIWRY